MSVTKREFFAAFNKEVVTPLRAIGYKGTAPRWSVQDEFGNHCVLTAEFDGIWITPRVAIYVAAVPSLWEEWLRVPYSENYFEEVISKNPMQYHGFDTLSLPEDESGQYSLPDLDRSLHEIGEDASRAIPEFTREALDMDLMRHKAITDTNIAYGYLRAIPLRSELATFVLFPYGSPESKKAGKALQGYRGHPRWEKIFEATLDWRKSAVAGSA